MRGTPSPGRWLAHPSLLWLVFFFGIPTLWLVSFSFRPANAQGGFDPGWTLTNWQNLGIPHLLPVLWRTLWLSLATTLICLLLAIPTGSYVARQPARRRPLFLLAILLPSWTSFLVRIFAWKTLLHPEGFVKGLLTTLGMVDQNAILMYRPLTVLLVLVYTYLPFAVLPIFAAADRFDHTRMEAARDLGATKTQAVLHVYLPGISRGIGVAMLLVLIPALGAYVIPELVGGVHAEMLGNKLAQRAFVDRNLPMAAVLGTCLLATVLVPLLLRFWWRRRSAAGQTNAEVDA